MRIRAWRISEASCTMSWHSAVAMLPRRMTPSAYAPYESGFVCPFLAKSRLSSQAVDCRDPGSRRWRDPGYEKPNTCLFRRAMSRPSAPHPAPDRVRGRGWLFGHLLPAMRVDLVGWALCPPLFCLNDDGNNFARVRFCFDVCSRRRTHCDGGHKAHPTRSSVISDGGGGGFLMAR